MLEVRKLDITWSGAPVLRGVDLSIRAGEAVALLGANGAGKSSLIAALAGLQPVAGGQILWDGRDVTRLPFHARASVALVPEGRVIAPSLTVAETLRLGAGRIRGAALRSRMGDVLARIPALSERLDQPAGTLSGGEAQMLSLGRALMAAPRLLLLDEPTAGLSPAASAALFAMLHDLRTSGLAMLLTDQDSRATEDLADRALQVADHLVTPAPHRHEPA